MSDRLPSTSIRAVKGFVVLAIVLLIPTMCYFQKQRFVNRLQPQLRASVMEILKAEGALSGDFSWSHRARRPARSC